MRNRMMKSADEEFARQNQDWWIWCSDIFSIDCSATKSLDKSRKQPCCSTLKGSRLSQERKYTKLVVAIFLTSHSCWGLQQYHVWVWQKVTHSWGELAECPRRSISRRGDAAALGPTSHHPTPCHSPSLTKKPWQVKRPLPHAKRISIYKLRGQFGNTSL